MTDPNDHLSTDITTEEAPAVIQQYQQWLADRDLTIAGLNVKVAKVHGRLQFALEDLQKMEAERDEALAEVENQKGLVEYLKQQNGVEVVDAPKELDAPSED